jgi:plastocyanin
MGGNAASVLNGCTDADYQDLSKGMDGDRMVMVPSNKNMYTPQCMLIAAGQSVMFMSDFTVHMLMPGIAPSRKGDTGATEPNPIKETSSGDQVTFTFKSPGEYPYYCMKHEASGMYGVIKVK